MDKAATVLTQLPKLKIKNEAITASKESIEKAKVDAEAKVKKPLQDKADLKKF